jgi:hypothetical protein
LHVRMRLDAASEIYFGNCPAHGGGDDPMLQTEPSIFATASGIWRLSTDATDTAIFRSSLSQFHQ